MSYAFHDPSIPSMRDVAIMIIEDQNLAHHAKLGEIADFEALMRLAQELPRFRALDQARTPFSQDVVLGLLERTNETAPAAEHARIAATCRAVLRRYALAHPPQWAKPNGALAELVANLPDDYRKVHVRRLLSFAATTGIDVNRLDDAAMEAFRAALTADPSVKRPDELWKSCAYAWNKLVAGQLGWPQRPVTMPRTREVWGLKWSAFPQQLEQQAELLAASKFTYLKPGSREARRVGRKAQTVKAAMMYLRLAATALVEAEKVAAATFDDIGHLFSVENFGLIIDAFITRAGGKVTRLVRTKIIVLRGLGNEAGLITDREAIDQLVAVLEARAGDYIREVPARQQQRAKALTSAQLALLLNGSEHLFAVARDMPMSRKLAAVLKLAMVVAFLNDAGVDLPILCGLRCDDLKVVPPDGPVQYAFKVAADKNGRWSEHAHELSLETSALVADFMARARDKLNWSGSDYLLPGQKGRPMTVIGLSQQLAAYLTRLLEAPCTAQVLLCAIRDRLLSDNPDDTEAWRAHRGHLSTEMADRAAEPFKVKAQRGETSTFIATGKLSAKGKRDA